MGGELMTTSHALKVYLTGSKFRRQLVRKYERFEILAEGGLRTAVAHALQTELRRIRGTAERYSVACEARLGNVVPDILVWKNEEPRFWIELKDTRTFNRTSAEADWKKLQRFCPKYPTIKGGYFIYVARKHGNRVDEFPIKRSRETPRLWPISIVLEDEMRDFKAWNIKYKNRAHYGTN
jgi:hypothetical protein